MSVGESLAGWLGGRCCLPQGDVCGWGDWCRRPRFGGTVLSVRLRQERRRKPGRMAGRALLSVAG
jgi:hypothetical protein